MNQNNQAEATRSQSIRTSKGSRTVVTSVQDGVYRSRLYVNCSTKDLGDATLVAGKHNSPSGAKRWADKVLAS